MAKLTFVNAPEGLKGKTYKFYRDWLEVNFFKELCSYCLLHFPKSLQIEHYEPQAYVLARKDDPDNLLLGCPWCNSGKKDYHPNYPERKRLPFEKDGFSVIDIRVDDFSDLFEIKESGEILPKEGSQKEKAIFNIVKLLRLDIPQYVSYRKDCLEYKTACEDLLLVKHKDKLCQGALKVLVKSCAERYLFYKAFNIPLSSSLEKLIKSYIDANKPKIS